MYGSLCNCNVYSACSQFEFINSYLSLFYIGFYLKDMERLKEVTTDVTYIRDTLEAFSSENMFLPSVISHLVFINRKPESGCYRGYTA